MKNSKPWPPLLAAACWLLAAGICWAQESTVSGKVVLEGDPSGSSSPATVVWLAPKGAAADSTPVVPMHAVLAQKNKMFEPHLLVVTRGSTVEFPNRDPWFHNVFSLFNGKRFDLGLYEAGTSRTVHFDREGVSFIFCNIHPEMSAVVVVLSSPYFAVTNKQGDFSLADVPSGSYTVHVWNEKALPATLQGLAHEVQVSDSSHSLGTIHVTVTKSATVAHKNKYGQDYEPPSPNNPVYAQPQ
jgi:plastocyanin